MKLSRIKLLLYVVISVTVASAQRKLPSTPQVKNASKNSLSKTLIGKFQSLKNFITYPIPPHLHGPVLYKPYLNYNPQRGVNDPEDFPDPAPVIQKNSNDETGLNLLKRWKVNKKNRVNDVKEALKNKVESDFASAAAVAQDAEQRQQMEILRRYHMHGIVDFYRPKPVDAFHPGEGWGWREPKPIKRKKNKSKPIKRKKNKTKPVKKKKQKKVKTTKKKNSGWGDESVSHPAPSTGWDSPTKQQTKTTWKAKTKIDKPKKVFINKKLPVKLDHLLPAAGSRTSNQNLSQTVIPASQGNRTKTLKPSKENNRKNIVNKNHNERKKTNKDTQSGAKKKLKKNKQKEATQDGVTSKPKILKTAAVTSKTATNFSSDFTQSPLISKNTSITPYVKSKVASYSHNKNAVPSNGLNEKNHPKVSVPAEIASSKLNKTLTPFGTPSLPSNSINHLLLQFRSPASAYYKLRDSNSKERVNTKLLRENTQAEGFFRRTLDSQEGMRGSNEHESSVEIVHVHNLQQQARFRPTTESILNEKLDSSTVLKENHRPGFLQILQFRQMPLIVYEDEGEISHHLTPF